jgi:hypothetical protein
LREENRPWAFQKRVLRNIFRPKRGEVTGEWRRLHNGKFYNLYSIPNISRVISPAEWDAAACDTHGARREAYRALTRKREGKWGEERSIPCFDEETWRKVGRGERHTVLWRETWGKVGRREKHTVLWRGNVREIRARREAYRALTRKREGKWGEERSNCPKHVEFHAKINLWNWCIYLVL